MEVAADDRYLTIAEPAKVSARERSSKFHSFVFPIKTEQEAKAHIDALKKEFYDATHHCWAWRTGTGSNEASRSNDDGEPSGTAGKPILGQMLSHGLTDLLIVVVRYFGGTKLGVPGLIAAYKESAAEVIGECRILEKTVDVEFEIAFPYVDMNDVMKVVKDMQPRIVSQQFDNTCRMILSIRSGESDALRERLSKCNGVKFEE